MKFIYPLEIWIAVFLAIIIKLQTSNRLTFLGVVITIFVATASALLFHLPIVAMMGWGPDSNVVVAVVLALTAENLMKAIVEISADRGFMKNLIKHVVKQD
tara:strand:+ start:710 stop:1012 length:303 start_codon:yes stop_codon:yes gene_type:complete